MNVRVFQKFEPSNKRGISKNCQICKKQFGMFNRGEHQCKRCLRPICQDCGKTKRDVYKLGMVKTPHRLCSFCSKESDFISQLISNNRLKFAEDCTMSKKWISKIPTQPPNQFIKSISYRQMQKFTYQIFCQMWDSYNFSLRQLMGLLTFDKDQKWVYERVKAVYENLLDKGLDEKIQNVMFVIVFVLCFASQQSCAIIVEQLIGLRQTVNDGKSLLQAYLKALKVDQGQMKKLSDYLSYKLKVFMGTFSVNLLSVQCSIHAISRALQRSKIEQFYMLLSIVIQQNISFLLINKQSKIDCDQLIVRNCQLQKYIQKYRILSSVKSSQFITKKLFQTDDSVSVANTISMASSPSPSNRTMPNINIDQKIILDQDDDHDEESRRKTQKHSMKNIKMEIIQNQNRDRFQSFNEERCQFCQKNKGKIQELINVLAQRDKEIDNLNFKLAFNKRDIGGGGSKGQNYNQFDSKKNGKEFGIQNQTILQQLRRVQQQNISYKLRLQQLEQANKALRSNLQLSSISVKPQKAPLHSSQALESPEFASSTITKLKQILQQKNSQLEQLIKKNKLLNYQIQQMQKQYSIKKIDANTASREELMKKIKELSVKVNEEQDEKIRLGEEVFLLREEMKSMEGNQEETDKDGERKGKGGGQVGVARGASQCTVF